MSKVVYDRTNKTVAEQVQDIMSLDLKVPKKVFKDYNARMMEEMRAQRRPQRPLVINDVQFNNIKEGDKTVPTTYLEDTVASLWKHMVDNQIDDMPNFLQMSKNQEDNARYMAMQAIVGKPGPE